MAAVVWCASSFPIQMDESTLRQYLAGAETHVRQGEVHLARQRQLIAALERDGHDTTQAERLLTTFEETQALHIADCKRLTEELARKRAE